MGHRFNAESRAKTRCYIINNDSGKKMQFQFNPTNIAYDRGANYASIQSPGMSYPLTQYSGGTLREFSFEVFYYDKPCTGKINEARNFLGKLLPPEYNTPYFHKPPTFTFAYGHFVRNYVLLNLNISEDWLDEDGNPIMTTFTLTVRQVGV